MLVGRRRVTSNHVEGAVWVWFSTVTCGAPLEVPYSSPLVALRRMCRAEFDRLTARQPEPTVAGVRPCFCKAINGFEGIGRSAAQINRLAYRQVSSPRQHVTLNGLRDRGVVRRCR